MYSLLMMIEFGFLFLLLIMSWIAGRKASNLLYVHANKRLRKRVRNQYIWISVIVLCTIGVIVTNIFMMISFDFIFWQDRLYFHIPLIALPVISILFYSLPRLRKLQKDIESGQEEDLKNQLSHPNLVGPFLFVPLGTLTVYYFALVPPIPFQWINVLIPILLLLILSFSIWILHNRRYKKVKHQVFSFPNKRLRLLQQLGGTVAVLAICGVFFFIEMKDSILPSNVSMMSGIMDYGGGEEASHHDDHSHHKATSNTSNTVSVSELTGPQSGEPDRKFTLIAEKKTVQLSSGKTVDTWTYNGEIPGTELRMKEGELIEVTLKNKDIEKGVTIHWHGLNVPNAEDGVAGATQNAVMPGEKHVYRFKAEQVGTFWYHSHQHSQEAVQKGLFGTLIVEPKDSEELPQEDVTVITHKWDNAIAIGSSDKVDWKKIKPGTNVRIRLINTDDWDRQKYVLVGTPFKVAAIDGTDLHEPEELKNTHLELTTGGRYDITFTMPDSPVFLSVGGKKDLGVLMSPNGKGEIPNIPKTTVFNPVQYGTPTDVPFNENTLYDREFSMVLDNKLGFYNGQFNMLYTINGNVFPNTPMLMVKEEDIVKITISNRGNVDHPMHLHGHHVLVLSRNGEKVTGSPWYSDTLDVLPGDTYEIAFIANNPGVWMDHCHNLEHATIGMTMHLMYEGITTPYSIGSETHNHPE